MPHADFADFYGADGEDDFERFFYDLPSGYGTICHPGRGFTQILQIFTERMRKTIPYDFFTISHPGRGDLPQI